ncbi:MAG: M50 family metallopeptidase [Patescibacteria group bacterium]|nr:M50 family metallopeptidase [Patescibacteria group bacterium]MDD4304134.1 M50 family metallopeptidase [Patescibacteria group bacterium]MDD4695165.1 M50 family metallopeptidase [Patescibacteria group bacterium]
MNIGLIIIIITILGYFSNFLNNKYLNNTITTIFYFVGAFIHETSHAIACILTGAEIKEFKIFSRQPKVSHYKSKIPILGQLFISLAPTLGGFLFLYLINKFLLDNYLNIQEITNFKDLIIIPLNIISQIKLNEWQSWILILLSLNIGAMIGPSLQDLKNIWPILIILFFIKWQPLENIGILLIGLIITNIILQFTFILIKNIFKKSN